MIRFGTAFVIALAVSACDLVPGSDVGRGKALAAQNLKDPSSARFRNLRAAKLPDGVDWPRLTSGGTVVCGEINGLNSFGAYAGFTRFIADLDAGTVWTAPDAEGSMAADAGASGYASLAFDTVYAGACGG